jgi:hypothetical protein
MMVDGASKVGGRAVVPGEASGGVVNMIGVSSMKVVLDVIHGACDRIGLLPFTAGHSEETGFVDIVVLNVKHLVQSQFFFACLSKIDAIFELLEEGLMGVGGFQGRVIWASLLSNSDCLMVPYLVRRWMRSCRLVMLP